MYIDYLDQHRGLVATLADWHHAQWGHLFDDWDIQVVRAELEGHATRRTLPTTLVMVEDSKPLGSVSLVPLLLLLISAAILGDTVNYWIGSRICERAFTGEIRFLKQSHLERTRAFYARHGGKTIVLARFIPIVRTFAPFVAGVARMDYPRFLMYNIAGGITWVVLFTVTGYLFGNIPVVRDNFTLVIFAIIGLSVLPIVIEMVRHRRAAA